jgi:hypothetical protein
VADPFHSLLGRGALKAARKDRDLVARPHEALRYLVGVYLRPPAEGVFDVPPVKDEYSYFAAPRGLSSGGSGMLTGTAPA